MDGVGIAAHGLVEVHSIPLDRLLLLRGWWRGGSSGGAIVGGVGCSGAGGGGGAVGEESCEIHSHSIAIIGCGGRLWSSGGGAEQ